MPAVPSVRGERIVRALERAGFKVARVTGSHHIMRHADVGADPAQRSLGHVAALVYRHRRAKGTLRGICSDVGMTIDELQQLL